MAVQVRCCWVVVDGAGCSWCRRHPYRCGNSVLLPLLSLRVSRSQWYLAAAVPVSGWVHAMHRWWWLLRDPLSLLSRVGDAVALIAAAVLQTLGADWLVASGHKMCGPTGIGFLWGRMSLLETMRPWQVRGGLGQHEAIIKDTTCWVPAQLPVA